MDRLRSTSLTKVDQLKMSTYLWTSHSGFTFYRRRRMQKSFTCTHHRMFRYSTRKLRCKPSPYISTTQRNIPPRGVISRAVQCRFSAFSRQQAARLQRTFVLHPLASGGLSHRRTRNAVVGFDRVDDGDACNIRVGGTIRLYDVYHEFSLLTGSLMSNRNR